MAELPEPFLTHPIAHRGLHDVASVCPENSRAAVAAAIDAGCGIEIDVQMAACGTPMVFHDDTLDRLTGHAGPVRAQDAAALGAMALHGTQETIPTLAEILSLTAGRAPLLIEIKDQSGCLGPVDGRLEAATCRVFGGYAGPVALMSFNPHSMAVCKDRAPGLPRGLTTCPFRPEDWPGTTAARCAALTEIADFDAVGASFVSHHHRALDMPAVTALRRRGVPVLCWTIRAAAEEAQALRHSDNVTFEGYRPAALLPQRH
ncbi:MAG: glycerophosphodiester phosphodiesterase family protein [Pseudomonadota bacterium]